MGEGIRLRGAQCTCSEVPPPARCDRPLATLALGVKISLCTAAFSTQAADSADHFVHWAYSAYFGTGWYQIGDRQDTFVLRFSPRWQGGETALNDRLGDQVNVQLRLPVTLGLHELDARNFSGAFDIDNFASVSLTPGIEVEIPLTERWTLKPYAYAGWGTEISADEQAWIYWSGLKSRFTFGDDDRSWSLLNAITYLGYSADDDQSSDAVGIMAGLAFQTPAPFSLFDGAPSRLHWHGTYTAYVDSLDFNLGRLPDAKIDGEWEIGAAISRVNGRIRFGRFELDRIGLAYRFSDRGDFEGISLEFRSFFDR